MPKTNGHSRPYYPYRGLLNLSRSYNNVAKNPLIDRLRTVMKDEGLNEKDVAVLSGVGYATIDGWTYGDTKNPQSKTITAAFGAMGYDLQPTRIKKMDYEAEMPKAQKWQEERKIFKLEHKGRK